MQGRVSRKAGMVRAGELSPQDRLGFHRQRLSRVRHPRGAAPRHPPACAPRPHHLPPRWASGEATGVGEARREPRLQQGSIGTYLSVRAGRRENVREAHTRGQPGLPPPQGTLERPGRPASTVGPHWHKPNLRARQGKAAARSTLNSCPPVGGALRDQWGAESPRATAPQAG